MRNSNMFFTREKLQKTVGRIEKYRYLDRKNLDTFLYKEDTEQLITPNMPTQEGFTTGELGMRWKGYNKYLWLQFNDITYKDTDKEVVCVFDFGKHVPDGNNEGFESETYIDGKLYQAIDANHLELFLTKEHLSKPLDLTFRVWSGLTGGHGIKDIVHEIKTAFIATFDEQVDQFFYLSTVMLETIERLEMTNHYDSDAILLLNLLNEAHLLIEFNLEDVDQEGFLKSIHKANKHLIDSLEGIDRKLDVTVHGVGHTHIDIAWLWQLKHTREKAQRSFSTVMRLMERYPEYKFMQTQAQIYYHLKNDRPEMYEEIKEKVKEGRWNVEGSMWVESDCNIPSGESLVRQVLYGKKFFKDEFDVETKILWLPDVFGYSWALPQILRKSDIDTFMTTKISWNEFNRLPHDTFFWKGIDGSEILTHCITTPYQYQPEDKIYGGYNAKVTPFTVEGLWRKYEDKEINNDVLMSYGYGDGGGGVNREMLENRRYINMMPGMPKMVTTTATDYFDLLHNKIDNTDKYVHTWNGELYFEYHRGTYTSQALTKESNRRLEFLYRKAEMLDVFANLNKKENNYFDFFEGWEKVLTNQFHDIIPGTSITEVYEDTKVDYQASYDIANESLDASYAKEVTADNNTITFYNDASFVRGDFVEFVSNEDLSFFKDGKELEAQKTDNGYLIFVTDQKPLSFVNVEIKKANVKDASNFTIKDKTINSSFYELKLNEFGQIESLYDKEADRIVNAGNLNTLQIFQDLPNDYDAWNVDVYYQEKMYEVNDLISGEVIENGNLRFVYRQVWKYQKSTITQDLILYHNNKRIDFKTHVDWQTQNQLLKATFPVDIHTNKATYDIQFGNVERPIHWNTSWDLAKYEVVGHKWANINESNYSVSLLNNNKYGYDIKDNVMRLSLLRGSKYPDPYQDQHEHNFTYSLLPQDGTWNKLETEQIAYNLNNPVTVTLGKAINEGVSLFKVNNEYVTIDAVKLSEDKKGIILRLHEFGGGRQNVLIESDLEIKEFVEVNLIERELDKKVKSSSITTTLNPFEIKTFKIMFK